MSASDSEKRQRLEEKLRREMGETVVELLDKADVEDILLNADGRLWVKESGVAYRVCSAMSPTQGKSVMATIASMCGAEVTHDKPFLEAEVPIWGARFEGIIEPVVRNPVFSIRRRASRVFTLDDYEESGALTRKEDPRNRIRLQERFAESVQGMSHKCVIRAAISERKNIIVAGSTGSGKTTFINAVLHGVAEITPDDRVIVIEDIPELQVGCENNVCLLAGSKVTMLDCLKATMRLRPTRIVVGEVRGPEALTLLKAWNTGHPGGLASLHANHAYAALLRLETLMAEDGSPAQPRLIAEAVDLVISVFADAVDGRKVREVAVVEGYEDGRYRLAHV